MAIAPNVPNQLSNGVRLPPGQAAYLARLADDFAFWAEECYHIKNKDRQLVPLRLNGVQRDIERVESELKARHGWAHIFVLKARQGGITTYRQAKSLHGCWANPGFTALTAAHEREATDRIFLITKRAIDRFPPHLRPKLGDAQTREVSFPALDSRIYTSTAGSTRIGRGLTIDALHASEFAEWDEPVTTLNSITPAQEGVIGHSTVLETTAGGYGSPAHEFWQSAVAGADDYVGLFYPWWAVDPARYRRRLESPDELTWAMLTGEERELVRVHGLDYEQLKWRRAKLARLSLDDFLKEYPEDPDSCWLAPGGLVYKAADLKLLKTRAAGLTPRLVEELGGGTLEWYAEPGDRCVLGADTAEGMEVGTKRELDRSAFVIRRYPDRALVAVYQSRKIEPDDFADLIVATARACGGQVLLVPEKNAHGITVIRRLRDHHAWPSELMYHRLTYGRDAQVPTAEAGWLTSAATKPLLVQHGRELIAFALAAPPDACPAPAAVTDAMGVRRDEQGRAKLNGRDVWVSECLCWAGFEYGFYEPPPLPPSWGQSSLS